MELKQKENTGKGDCIIVACNNIIQNQNLKFCYAYVMGRGKLTGQRILHAWNELNGIVFDYSNGNKILMHKERYYKLADIKESDVTKQTSEEVMRLLLEFQTYGGWIK